MLSAYGLALLGVIFLVIFAVLAFSGLFDSISDNLNAGAEAKRAETRRENEWHQSTLKDRREAAAIRGFGVSAAVAVLFVGVAVCSVLAITTRASNWAYRPQFEERSDGAISWVLPKRGQRPEIAVVGIDGRLYLFINGEPQDVSDLPLPALLTLIEGKVQVATTRSVARSRTKAEQWRAISEAVHSFRQTDTLEVAKGKVRQVPAEV